MATKTFDTSLAVIGKVSQTVTPVDPTDLVTKAYADALTGGGEDSGLKMSELEFLTAEQMSTSDLIGMLDEDDTGMALTGTNKVALLSELYKRMNPVMNTSVAQQTGFSSDTYLTGSNILIPPARLRAKSVYTCRFNAVKTGAGTATPIITVRLGTAGAIGDTSRAVMTFPVQTGVADEALFDISVIFRTVGSGTSAVIQAVTNLSHRLSTTGFSNVPGPTVIATSSGFDSTVSNLQIGVSVNGGASAAWTINSVIAELLNLA